VHSGDFAGVRGVCAGGDIGDVVALALLKMTVAVASLASMLENMRTHASL